MAVCEQAPLVTAHERLLATSGDVVTGLIER